MERFLSDVVYSYLIFFMTFYFRARNGSVFPRFYPSDARDDREDRNTEEKKESVDFDLPPDYDAALELPKV